MKLVFTTQVRENYAAHDEFIGEYRWKFKGGSTYVVQGLTPNQAAEMVIEARSEEGARGEGFIAKCFLAIESFNDYFEEYIIDVDVYDDSEDICEFWEIPYLHIMTSSIGDELVFEQNSKLLRDGHDLAIPEKVGDDDDWYHTGEAV